MMFEVAVGAFAGVLLCAGVAMWLTRAPDPGGPIILGRSLHEWAAMADFYLDCCQYLPPVNRENPTVAAADVASFWWRHARAIDMDLREIQPSDYSVEWARCLYVAFVSWLGSADGIDR